MLAMSPLWQAGNTCPCDHLVNEHTVTWGTGEGTVSLLFSTGRQGQGNALIFAIKPTVNWAKETPYVGHGVGSRTAPVQPTAGSGMLTLLKLSCALKEAQSYPLTRLLS